LRASLGERNRAGHLNHSGTALIERPHRENGGTLNNVALSSRRASRSASGDIKKQLRRKVPSAFKKIIASPGYRKNPPFASLFSACPVDERRMNAERRPGSSLGTIFDKTKRAFTICVKHEKDIGP
jgi:hypothetical protein